MSRAFVKEPEGALVGEPDMDLPQSPHPAYITPRGKRALETRLEELRAERDRMVEAGETFETSLHLAQVERDIRYYETRLERAIVVDPAKQHPEEVGFGATVTVADPDGNRQTYEIVGEDEMDVDNNRIPWVSPLATALIGNGPGDTITWKRPAGDLELEIVDLRYPDAE